jgi:hypothetical protein
METNKSVYLAWQLADSRDWHVVGLLTAYADKYTFNYTKGAAKSSKFRPFDGMETLDKEYISKELFPLFKNRLLSAKRPEYPRFIDWLGLKNDEISPIAILSRSGGQRGTDQLQMFNPIEIDQNGHFEYVFFAHGLGHLAPSAMARVSTFKQGEKLYLCLDKQNEHDKNAVIIRTESPVEIVGYCPRYLARTISLLFENKENKFGIAVETLSDDAPNNYKLMCKVTGTVCQQSAKDLMDDDEFHLLVTDSH